MNLLKMALLSISLSVIAQVGRHPCVWEVIDSDFRDRNEYFLFLKNSVFSFVASAN